MAVKKPRPKKEKSIQEQLAEVTNALRHTFHLYREATNKITFTPEDTVVGLTSKVKNWYKHNDAADDLASKLESQWDHAYNLMWQAIDEARTGRGHHHG